jgi:hypothetical protein
VDAAPPVALLCRPYLLVRQRHGRSVGLSLGRGGGGEVRGELLDAAHLLVHQLQRPCTAHALFLQQNPINNQ